MLDGASRLDEIVEAAAKDKQPGLGITDHGNMYGVLPFYRACKAQGIKPIIGTEAYMAYDSRHERPKRGRGNVDDSGGNTDEGRKLYYHLTLLAENNSGYKNLIQIASRAYMEGFYYKPRIDWEVLNDHSDGIIATTGCLGGQVLQALLRGDEAEALERAGRLQEIFGKDNLFVELQDHGIPEQKQTNPALMNIAAKLGAPLLATNDCHYTHQGDHVAHDALLCVQTGSLISDPNRLKFHGDQHYLKTANEMRYVFKDVEVACDNTLWIAERADVEIEFGNPLLPDFPLPEGFEDDDQYLQHLTLQGARERWGEQLSEEISDRLAYELRVMSDMGFSAYFLITWDLIRYAREKSIRVGPGRGSAAGSAVAYALKITDLDPIKYDLLFERFLNPSRISMPDIDMDFDSRYRDAMISYVAAKYGRDHVAQIITFSQIKGRAAVRDAARVLDKPYAVGDQIAKAIPPPVMGRDTPLWACIEKHEQYLDGYKSSGELRQMYENDPVVKEVIDVALGLEGLRRQDSIHAAGVVITKEPLTEYLPIQRKPEKNKDIEDAPVVTQYEMQSVEDLGLLKMDFLGLRNLDVITDTLELIEETTNEKIDIDNVPLDDSETFALLAAGESIGVFQLESPPMRSLMKALVPSSFEDVAALVALYRPGPMAANMHHDYADRKNNRKPVEYFHPDAEELLKDTYGLMIYQESVMRVAQKFAGYSLADADSLRKAMGKKIRKAMEEERERFTSGMESMGYEAKLGVQVFDVIAQFADYAFNKSHSYGYGLIAYQTAYLKTHYPVQYMAALMTSVKGRKKEDSAIYLNECRLMGLNVVVPGINQAGMNYYPDLGMETNDQAIIYGLSAIRNVGEGIVTLLLEERNMNGPFEDFYDFCSRVDMQVLNRRAIEALIKAGSFDSMGHPRQGLLAVYERIVEQTVSRRRERDMGVMTLFESAPEESSDVFDEKIVIPDLEFEKPQRLAFEKEMLGRYISDHPLNGYEGTIRRKCDVSTTGLGHQEEGKVVKVGGVISELNKKYTTRGDLMANISLEDLEGSVEIIVFTKVMSQIGHKLINDQPVIITGRVDRRDEILKLVCMDVETLKSDEETKISSIEVQIPSTGTTTKHLENLASLLNEHPGECDVYVWIGSKKIWLGSEVRVNPDNGLMGELRVLLGADSIL
jgi:DNA polymerase-3 subunit alpha